MKYCSDCKKIYFTENEKCECGKRFSKKLDSNAPIEVICVSSEKRGEAEQCLINAEIPYSVQDRSGYSPSVGKIQGDVAYLVPLSFLKTAIEVLSENGLLTASRQRPRVGGNARGKSARYKDSFNNRISGTHIYMRGRRRLFGKSVFKFGEIIQLWKV